MKFIAYFTLDTPYEAEAVLLKESLDRLGLDHDVRAVPRFRTWQRATQYKATFCRQMLGEYPGRPLCYVDVDALVMRDPRPLFDVLDCDVAAARHRGIDLLSGTVYFGGTDKTREVVDRWCDLCEQYPEAFPAGMLSYFPNGSAAWDQRMLDIAIQRTPDTRFVVLPPEYTYIQNLTEKLHPKLEPMILHTRASMRFRKLIDYGVAV